jgi:hypothetical protein
MVAATSKSFGSPVLIGADTLATNFDELCGLLVEAYARQRVG